MNHASVKIQDSTTDAYCEASPEYICEAGWDQLIKHHMDNAAKQVTSEGGSVGEAVVPLQLEQV